MDIISEIINYKKEKVMQPANTRSILTKTDSYKATHPYQYPKGTEYVYSYGESRGGRFDNTLAFGMQYVIKKHLLTPITKADVDRAEWFWNAHFGVKGIFKREMWDHIVDNLGGKLPVRICAVAEGTIVPTHNVLWTIENTDPKCWSLTNFLESILLQVWASTTVGTYSRECKKIILKYLKETGDESLILFKFHDFGYRGVSSDESAQILGAAHLVNFLGTDTVAGIEMLMSFYNAEMCGFSIPASEHSTITSWGRENESKAYENMLDLYPTGYVACVSDSWDIDNAVDVIWGQELHDKVIARDGTLVIRPDSGDPVEVTLNVVESLGKRFGYTVNEKGYKVLDPHVRIIQGDGVNIDSIEAILENYKKHGWSADNIAFGAGGKLLQAHDRDEQKFAIKCSAIIINGVETEVYKQPKTDPGKNSKRGRLRLVKDSSGKIFTLQGGETAENVEDLLVPVYENGELLVEYNLEEIRERAKV